MWRSIGVHAHAADCLLAALKPWVSADSLGAAGRPRRGTRPSVCGVPQRRPRLQADAACARLAAGAYVGRFAPQMMVLLTSAVRPAGPADRRLAALEGWRMLVAAMAAQAPTQLGQVVFQARVTSGLCGGRKSRPYLQRLTARARARLCATPRRPGRAAEGRLRLPMLGLGFEQVRRSAVLLLGREPVGARAQVVVVLQEALQEGGPVAAAAARAVEELVVGNRGLLQAQLRRLPPLPPGVDALAKARAGRRPWTCGVPAQTRLRGPARCGARLPRLRPGVAALAAVRPHVHTARYGRA